MDLPFELHVAFRYLLAKRKQALLSVITLISTLGVIVGVMARGDRPGADDRPAAGIAQPHLGSQAHVYVFEGRRHRGLPGGGRQAAAGAARGRGGSGDYREGPDDGGPRGGVRLAERDRSGARAGRHRSGAARSAAAALVGAGHAGRRRCRRHPARQGPGREARRRVGDSVSRAHAAGHPVADGHDAAAAARRGRRDFQPRPATSSTASTAS